MCPPGYACPIQDQDVRYYWKLYSLTYLLILCVASLFSLSCWSCVCFFQRILSINHVVIDNVCLDRTIRKSVVSCFWHFVYYRNLCPNGTYSLGAQITCTPCLPGSKCPSISEGPTICPPGYFSERNAAECKLCEAGKQCADPSGKCILKKSQDESIKQQVELEDFIHFLYLLAPEPCPPGYYSSVGWIICLPCKRGFQCKEGSTTDSPPEGWLSTHFMFLHLCGKFIRDLYKVQLEFKTEGSILRKTHSSLKMMTGSIVRYGIYKYTYDWKVQIKWMQLKL